MGKYTTPLARHAPKNPLSDDELKHMRKAMWQKQGYLLLRPEDCKDDWERLFLKNKGVELYGKHHSK